MEGASHLLTALAALLWPVMVLLVLMRVAPVLQAIVESAKERGFTVEIAGQKLSMQELTRQQGDTIGDLLAQVVALRSEIDTLSVSTSMAQTYSQSTNDSSPPTDAISSHTNAGSPPTNAGSPPTNARSPSTNASSPRVNIRASTIEEPFLSFAKVTPRRILWVDDRPTNNSYLISQLQNLGIMVDQFTTTRDAITAFESNRYDAVVSDMGRQEGSAYNAAAGIEITKLIRTNAPDIPVIIYCSATAARQQAPAAFIAGANRITSSPTDLLSFLRGERPRTPQPNS